MYFFSAVKKLTSFQQRRFSQRFLSSKGEATLGKNSVSSTSIWPHEDTGSVCFLHKLAGQGKNWVGLWGLCQPARLRLQMSSLHSYLFFVC